MTTCFTWTSFANHFSGTSFLRAPKRRKSLGTITGIYGSSVITSQPQRRNQSSVSVGSVVSSSLWALSKAEKPSATDADGKQVLNIWLQIWHRFLFLRGATVGKILKSQSWICGGLLSCIRQNQNKNLSMRVSASVFFVSSLCVSIYRMFQEESVKF